MSLSWNEIRQRAINFSREWKNEKRERAEAQSFWNDFFNIFGISRRRIASFEEPVRKLDERYGFIDLFWKGVLLIEHKSQGEDLAKAYSQALDYFAGLKEHELPKYVLVSDFEKFKLHNLDDAEEHEFNLSDLHNNIHLLGFIAGYEQKKERNQIPLNINAAEKMGELHDELMKCGFQGHELEVFITRLMFCMFADDTGLFDKSIFADYIREFTKEDGSDLGGRLAELFQTLDMNIADRQKNIDVTLNQFPYVNGLLFREKIKIAHFDSKLRDKLLHCCGFNWSGISPAIFGSMFQSAMDPQKRRELGAHYTSEAYIMRVIEPLFLDGINAEFQRIRQVKTSKIESLRRFHSKVSDLKFLDPACGCGNFLVVTYRELRKLEIEVFNEMVEAGADAKSLVSTVNIEQFFGIEKEEFPANIAATAMWLIDHQMNVELSKKIGIQRESLPLGHSMKILNQNSLQTSWEEFAPKTAINYIIGNPPFKGENYQTDQEKKRFEINFYWLL